MALRFRKSITIFPGVKINIGKTGPSLSVGVPGFRKTYHTDGRVTTTVGLPGTGLSWTETSRPNQQRSSAASTQSQGNTRADNINDRNPQVERTVSAAETIPTTPSDSPKSSENVARPTRKANNYIDAESIKSIYTGSDDIIEWTEIAAGADPDDLLMDEAVWKYCKKVANKVLAGDIDAYLDTIEELRPVDDLLLYGCDFEFGTDKSSYMEVEFNAIVEDLLPRGINDSKLEELVCGTTIRVAKDIMAMLPVSKVIVHAVIGDDTVLSVLFEKKIMLRIDYKNTAAKDIVAKFRNNYGIINGSVSRVKRLEI